MRSVIRAEIICLVTSTAGSTSVVVSPLPSETAATSSSIVVVETVCVSALTWVELKDSWLLLLGLGWILLGEVLISRNARFVKVQDLPKVTSRRFLITRMMLLQRWHPTIKKVYSKKPALMKSCNVLKPIDFFFVTSCLNVALTKAMATLFELT